MSRKFPTDADERMMMEDVGLIENDHSPADGSAVSNAPVRIGDFLYYDVEQGSDDWFELRKGVPTASRFGMILTPRTLKPSASQRKLICELIGERLSMIPPEGVENFTNRAIRWGQQCEAEARRWYTLETGLQVHNGGFCTDLDGHFGASPDGLPGDFCPDGLIRPAGCLELKCPQAETQAEYLLDNCLPDDYRCQAHGHLIVTGLPWCDFLSYSPGLRPLLIRVVPDDFTARLKAELEAFHPKYLEALSRVRGEGSCEA